MQTITIPKDVSTDTQRAIQQINQSLQHLNIPIYTEKHELSAIKEGTSAYYVKDGKTYKYTKIDGELFIEELGKDDTMTDSENIRNYSSEF
ncbi:hypothetical protein F4X90_20265 [Candidatus Poribacteria bacterium]|nr:hypothetical protein [Candidatus Poribacteria bacterium]